MKRIMINTTVTPEAKRIYDTLPSRKKGEFISHAIIMLDSLVDIQEPFTEVQKQYINDRITEAVHTCYKP